MGRNNNLVVGIILIGALLFAKRQGLLDNLGGNGGGGTVKPPPASGGGGIPGGSIDGDGIQQFFGNGSKTVIEQTRTDSGDHRWSGNVSGLAEFGYEATMIVDFTNASVSGDGHFAMKGWGPNHSGSATGEECCWYDFGIRENGDVQTEIEQPHPSNSSVPCPGCLMDNVGVSMAGSIIGLKWVVAPLTPNGTSSNGGIRLIMWVDTNALTGGVPSNNWQLVLDGVDNGEILNDGYAAPDEQDMEIRISDTDGEEAYMGLHVVPLTSVIGTGAPAAEEEEEPVEEEEANYVRAYYSQEQQEEEEYIPVYNRIGGI